MGSYEIAALLICVFWFVGCCSGPMQGPSSSSNAPTMPSAPPVYHAMAKSRYVVSCIAETVQGLVRDGATGSEVGVDDVPILAAVEFRISYCCAPGPINIRSGIKGPRGMYS